PAAASSMERIEVIAAEVPLERAYAGSIYAITHRTAVVTRVTTRDGIVGEALNTVGEKGLLPGLVRIIEEEIAPAIIGQSLFATERCWQIMDRATDHASRDRRLGLRAMACVDTALWDGVGKALGAPLYRLWGGYRDIVPVIAIAGYHTGEDAAAFGDEMLELKALGMGGCKFKVGRDPAEDAERVRAAREAAGPDFVLCVDANRGWSRQEAIDFGRRIGDCGIR